MGPAVACGFDHSLQVESGSAEPPERVSKESVEPAGMSASQRRVPQVAESLRGEVAPPGLSVVIAVRECLETARRRRKLVEVKPS